MKKIIGFGLCFLSVVCGQMFPGPGTPAKIVVAYVGPGDVSSGAAAWWGLRAYSTATRGNKAANVCIPSDAACADLVTDVATGALIIPMIGGSSCGVVLCTVKTLYDQTGNTNCNGVTCDVTQATIANRPTLTLNCLGSTLPCMTWSGSQTLLSANATNALHPQPFSVSGVGQRTGSFTSYGDILGTSGGSIQLAYNNSANTALLYAGNLSLTATAADSSFHAIQGLLNGVSSILYIDGSSTSGNPGGTSFPSVEFMCVGTCGNPTTGKSTEGGVWFSDTSANFSALNANQRAYWGF